MCAWSSGRAFFPLDKRWGLDASGYSPELKRQMVWLSGLLPYAQAETVMKRIGKRTISDSSLWRSVEGQGEQLKRELESTVTAPCAATSDTPLWNWGKTLSMDGGMVNIRDEGWKELKVGLVGDVLSIDPPESSVIPEVHTVPRAYTGVLGDCEAFTPRLVHMARTYGFFEAAQSSMALPGRGPLRIAISRTVRKLSIGVMLPTSSFPTNRRRRRIGSMLNAISCLKGQ